ncbi:Wzz/FepE/Etk N-terminal domain-containing protein [Kitasatospora sp. GP82]|uniref:YveK family protein n=1 Tax=Kitasatospora sp. GP82 TaxID=3035089 RepID=UPI0024742101|nr:Wzz/FepE/Etk N-terminal domain-containing protein [Kitasatospora sp. GP82]MDH6129424.1 capsular polysaccharide biosynthesis protein [Kitasatospora sp. GP82]
MSELGRSARALSRRWWPVALAVPLGALAGVGYGVLAHPSYAANSYVVVVPQGPGESATAVNFAQAYGRLAGQPQVLAGAAAELGKSTAVLAGLVRGTTSPDAPVIEITGTGSHAEDAMQAADAVAKSLVSFANTSSKETGVRLVPLAPAAEPEGPSSPSARVDTAVGAAAGVLIGALVMMTRRRSATPADGAPTPPRPRTESAEPAGTARTSEEPQEAGSRG